MEYLSGQSLARIWKKGKRLGQPVPPSLAAHIVARAAEGLAHAHERKAPDGSPLQIIHRDVSPENIVVTYDGQVKVVDFGIAHAANRLTKTKTGLIKGKVSYMSPEQLQSQPMDARSDLFSLGVVLHEALCGEKLFYSEDEHETVRKLLTGPVPSLADVPGVTAELAQIVERALARDPHLRLQTARELARALDDAIAPLQPRASADTVGQYVQSLFLQERADEVARLKTAVAPDIEDFLFGTPPAVSSVSGARPVSAGTRRYVPPARPKRALALLGVVPVLALVGWAAIALWPAQSARSPATPVAAAVAEPVPVVAAPAPTPLPTPSAATSAPMVPAPAPAPPKAAHRRPSLEHPVKAASAPAAAEKPAGHGRLTFDTVPWTEVYLDGRKLGVTPLVELQLPSGKHSLRLVNSEKQIDRGYDINIANDETLTVPRVRL